MSDIEIRFMPVAPSDESAGVIDLSKDERLALLAACINSQQAAGFRELIDMREVPCGVCKSPGFNTGWGVFKHTCGAEWHGNSTPAEPCSKAPK